MNWRGIDNVQLELDANYIRQQMQTIATSPVDIYQILKSKGIIAYFHPLANDAISGMAVKVKDSKGKEHLFMMVNTAQKLCKQRFTACHELYHLLFQESFDSSYDKDLFSPQNIEERKANLFASFLLLPEMGIRMLTPYEQQKKDKITLATVLMLEQNFRCSHSTLLYRLQEIGMISRPYLDKLQPNVRLHAREYGYSTELYNPTYRKELIGDYNILARRLYENGIIDKEKYHSYIEDMQLS